MLWDELIKIARNSGFLKKLDPIADYIESYNTDPLSSLPITHDRFDTRFDVDYGGSEGIYLDAYLEGLLDYSGDRKVVKFGIIKTLRSDNEALGIMGEVSGLLQSAMATFWYKNPRIFEPDLSMMPKINRKDLPKSCKYCGHIGSVQEQHCYKDDAEFVRYVCLTCGAASFWTQTSRESRHAWEDHASLMEDPSCILVNTGAVRGLCKWASKCKGKCGKCPKGLTDEREKISCVNL